MSNLDLNLYSRQIGTYGIETMAKILQLKVFISGLRGVGIETAKNLILAGPHLVTIHDDNVVSISDLASNFCLTERDVGHRTRSQACIDTLQQLNPYVRVTSYTGPLNDTILSTYNVVFLSESDYDTLVNINNFCRLNNPPIAFLSCECFGACGYGFVDFGEEFVVYDRTGEENKAYYIADITQGNPGVVTIHEEMRNTLQDGDYVVFKEVQGMVELNDTPPRPIKYIGPYGFSIEDTSNYSPYLREGIVEQVKIPCTLKFKSFEQSCHDPVIDEPLIVPDLSKFGRSEQLHIAIRALREYQRITGQLPELNNLQHAEEVYNLAVQINNHARLSQGLYVEDLDRSVIEKVSLYSRSQISPLASFWGGIMAQEILKLTGKYTPLRQFLYYDCFEILPENADRSPSNSRYDDQIAILGHEIQQKLQSVNTFLIGAGALGCEFLKNFGLMGVGCGNGSIAVSDDDIIEVSNLNRQFLFNREDVGQSKSKCAANKVGMINSDLKVVDRQDRVSIENERVYNDEFWDGLDFITNAVDSVDARLYIDSKCIWHEKPLLESGTLGTKANSQVIIPHKTQSYGDSQDPPEESIPLCTLKNFPHTIEHCIEWSRDMFEGLFTDIPKEVNLYLSNPTDYIHRIKSDNIAIQRKKLEKVKIILDLLRYPSFETCIKHSRYDLQQLFHNEIAQILYNFPIDFMTSEGQPFWSGPKRAPTPLEFDINDPDMLGYIVASANLYANMIGIPQSRNIHEIATIANRIEIAPFVPKRVFLESTDMQSFGNEFTLQDDESVVATLRESMKTVEDSFTNIHVYPAVFEKDNDSNFHIDYIHACSSLRAKNYKIAGCGREKTKMIAGKIIPAIATTTGMIAGAVMIELYKLIQNTEVQNFRNCFCNLALPLLVFSEPLPPLRFSSKGYDPILMGPVKAYPEKFSTWDKLIVSGPCTLQEFINKIEEAHRLRVKIVSSGQSCIYNSYLPDHKHDYRLPKQLHLLYEEVSETKILSGRHYLAIECSCEGVDSKIDVMVPVIKYTF